MIIKSREEPRRREPEWLAQAAKNPNAKLMLLWRGKARFENMLPQWTSVAEQDGLEGGPLIFLGIGENDEPLFARELTSDSPGVEGRFTDIRRGGAHLDGMTELGPIAYARSLTRWHRVNPRCANCGGETQPKEAGFARECPGCSNVIYPRTDPAVMVLVTLGDQCLLARQPGFPPGMYSALAGFVEHGESLEECVTRETFEEVGLRVQSMRYLCSQPWPFPASLMFGFEARVESDAFRLDEYELEDARWFSKEELRSPQGFFYPPPISLAHRLIRDFSTA